MFSAWLDPAGPPPLLCSLSQSALMPRIDLEKMLRPRRQYKKQTAPPPLHYYSLRTQPLWYLLRRAPVSILNLSDTMLLIQHNIPLNNQRRSPDPRFLNPDPTVLKFCNALSIFEFQGMENVPTMLIASNVLLECWFMLTKLIQIITPWKSFQERYHLLLSVVSLDCQLWKINGCA